MIDFHTLNPAIQEITRRNQASVKRAKMMGRKEAFTYAIEQLETLRSLQTEIEVRKELPELVKHLKEQE